MEVNHHEEPLTGSIESAPGHFPSSSSNGRDLADLNTKLKQENAELRRERDFLRMIFDSLPDRIYAKDKSGRFVFNNQAHAGRLGAKAPEEMKGKSDFDFFPQELARQFFEDEQKIIQTGAPIINQEQYGSWHDASRERRWAISSKVPWRDPAGGIQGTIGITRDIHEIKIAQQALRESEKILRESTTQLLRERDLLRQVIDNVPDNIYAKDRFGRFILNNPAHAFDLGAKTPEELKGKSDFDFFPHELAQQFFADEQKIIKTGTPVINQEQFKGRHGDLSGRKYWSVSSKVIWRDDSGEVLGTIGITRDIHELKLAQEALRESEEKLRESAARLERSNRELQDFAYVASHDLQEPLRKIVVFGERLREKAADRLDPDTLDYLQRMQKAASRMQNLINDLLAFSRVTTKAQPFSPVDLARVAHEVIDDLEGRIETTGGRVEIGNLPSIDAEPVQVRQLFQNLIGNALKFRRPDVPPVVEIKARIFSGLLAGAPPEAKEQPLCELTVRDNGIGFDEKYLDRIFNVFQRLHTREEYEGTGMGLAIAKKIAVYHGGTITAKSAPGHGAAFIVTLPAAHAKPPNAGT